MIRSDGKLFPVTVHIYGNPDTEDVEETLYAAEWLYGHTQFAETKRHIVELLASYVRYLDPDATRADIEPTLLYQIKHQGYKTVSESFIKSLDFSNAKMYSSVSGINKAVVDDLNQEFLRARYGGMYDSETGNGEMYFRISSYGFNWFPIIWDFVYNNKSRITSVTVVKDPESTGTKGLYLQHNGKKIDRMPADEFINLSGRPTMDSYRRIEDIFPDMNMKRRHETLLHCHTRHLEDFVKGKDFYRS